MRSLVLGLPLTTPLLCQPQEPERQTIPALLAEVHQLRLAIERSTLLGTRMQIALQRIQMQEMRTTRMSQELERVRKEAADSQLGYAIAMGRLKNDEEKLSQLTDLNERKQLEEVVKRSKIDLDTSHPSRLCSRRKRMVARLANCVAVHSRSPGIGRLVKLCIKRTR